MVGMFCKDIFDGIDVNVGVMVRYGSIKVCIECVVL